MELFITDNETIYNQSLQKFKLLFQPYQFTNCSFLTETELTEFNLNLNGIEYKAAELMLQKLYHDINCWKYKKFNTNNFLATRSQQNQLHTLLYTTYWHILTPKYGLELCIQNFFAFYSTINFTLLTFNLSEKYTLLQIKESQVLNVPQKFQFYKEKKTSKLKLRFKQVYYLIYDKYAKLFRKIRTPYLSSQKHVVLFLYDAPSIHIVLATFFELVKVNKEKIFLSIIEVSMGVADDIKASASNYACENIAVYNLKEFRCVQSISHNNFYDFLESQNPAYRVFSNLDYLYNLELNTAWVNNVFLKLNPASAVYLGVLELGRVISDVSRFYNKPSFNVEYGMFSNDPFFMESNIEFTHRVCISENASAIWRNRKDPSIYHDIIGFCKLDLVKNIKPDKETFFTKYKLNTSQKTILFASTWMGNNSLYESEKRIIVQHLSTMCHRNNWNLIIKKHPSESDSIVNDVIGNIDFQCVVGANVNVYELITYCDFLCTQSSSIVSESLYMDKPFCYISLSKDMSVNNYSAMAQEKLVKVFNDFGTFESFLTSLFIKDNYTTFVNVMQPLKEKYLFKSDGLASQRLLNLLLAS